MWSGVLVRGLRSLFRAPGVYPAQLLDQNGCLIIRLVIEAIHHVLYSEIMLFHRLAATPVFQQNKFPYAGNAVSLVICLVSCPIINAEVFHSDIVSTEP